MANFDDDDIRLIEDVQQFFGYPRGTGMGYIVNNADIKKLAKRKPFINPNSSFTSDANRDDARKRPGSWGSSVFASGIYGVYTGSFHSDTAAVDNWVYRRPTVAPYRWFDFLHYNHTPASYAPLTVNMDDEFVFSSAGTGRFTFTVSVSPTGQDDKNLSFLDVTRGTLTDRWMIVGFRFKNGNNYAWYFARPNGEKSGGRGYLQDWLTYTHNGLMGAISVDTYNIRQAVGSAYCAAGNEVKVFVFVGKMANAVDTVASNVTESESLEWPDAGATAVSCKTLTIREETRAWYYDLSGAASIAATRSSATATERTFNISSYSGSFTAGANFTARYLYYRIQIIVGNGTVAKTGSSERYSMLWNLPSSYGAGQLNPGGSLSIPFSDRSNYNFYFQVGQGGSIVINLVAFTTEQDAINCVNGHTVVTASASIAAS